ncbi:phage tail assembly protein [Acinetobacter sp. Tr-809]|uniref:phage tail assembly protein n=1 Tax=Acinetobacter sp. Tr-809 TaxID=2608324 RepID=UPI00141DB032|nr:phage tail assembly protein [Acinetobacter sp. Tr-809]NIE97448.1 phage tail assembly protein [Acinetobacter sp. Tr-809]
MSTTEQTQNAEAIADPNVKTVLFDFGFKRGETLIKEVVIRKPKTRALRGLTLSDLLRLDVDTIATLTPRITQPVMSVNDVYDLEPVDLTKIGKEIISFFVKTTDEDFQ